MPDGRACCDDVVVRQDGGGWKVEVADDWQRPMWGGSTGEPWTLWPRRLGLSLLMSGLVNIPAFRYYATKRRHRIANK